MLLKTNSKLNFVKVFRKFQKISRKSFLVEFFLSEFHAFKRQPSALRVFKIPENFWDNVCCSVPLLQKQALVDTIQNWYSKQLFGNLLGSLTHMLLKDSPTNILLVSFQ